MSLLGVAMEGVDGVGNVLPVLLAEVSTVEVEVATAPGVDEGRRGLLAPAVLADRHGAGVGRRGGCGGGSRDGRRRRYGLREVAHR